jgi:hypothetical protein
LNKEATSERKNKKIISVKSKKLFNLERINMMSKRKNGNGANNKKKSNGSSQKNKVNKENINSIDKTNSPGFRLNAKQAFLTYPNLNIAREDLLKQLNLKFPVKNYIISKEEHVSGEFHMHAYIEFTGTVNIRNPHVLDIFNGKELVHGNYQGVKSKPGTIQYLTKEDTKMLTSLDLKASLDRNMVKKSTTDANFYKTIFEIAKESGYEEALDFFCEKRPDLVPKSYASLKRNLVKYCEDVLYRKELELEHPLSSYNPPKELKNWVENDMDNKSLILIGKPGTGKTEYLIALLNSLGLNPFLVKDLNILRELTPLNKAIIFDDISISHLDAMQKLSLFDKEQDTQLRILYKSIRINQSTIKAFTKNDLESLLPSDDTYFEAMKRRVAIVTIDKPLFNIQINVDNRIDIIIDNSTTNITNIIEKKMDNIINTEEEKNNINDVSILFC